MEVSNLVTVVAASCILHNICEMNNEDVLLHWLEETEQATAHYPQPDHDVLQVHHEDEREDSVSIRNHFANFLMSDAGSNLGTG